MTVIHVLPKRFEDFLRHLDCNSPTLRVENPCHIPLAYGTMPTPAERPEQA